MTDETRQPTRDELLAMAYVDGELDTEERGEVERRMGAEPALAREVAQLQKLAVIARQTAPPEPMDHEWQRLESGFVQPGGRLLGFLFLIVAGLGMAGWLAYEIAVDSEMPLGMKVLLGLGSLGLFLLFFVVLRGRLRTLPYDPYTEVKR